MKKVISLMISILLIFTMTVTSSAATITSLVAGVGTDADRTVQVTVLYENPEEAQESTLLVVKKDVSIVTATADQIRYIDQKVVDGNSVTYSFKMAKDDRTGQYDLYVGGTKVDAPETTVLNFDTDATTTIKFVKEDGTEIASQVLVSSKLGDIIDLSSYAPETITYGTSIYKKDASNPTNYTVSSTTNNLTITYTYDSEVPKEVKQFVVYGITYNATSENLVSNGTFETSTDGWNRWDGSAVATLGSFSRSTTQAHSGDYSLKCNENGGGSSNGNLLGQFDLGDEVQAGDKYVLSFWSYSDGDGMTLTVGLGNSTNQVDIDCGGLGNSNSDPISCNISGLAKNAWRQHIYVLTAKSDSAFAEIYARWLGTNTYFDDVELYKVEQVYNSYAIGDEYEYGGVTYAVASENLISNGSFENAEGNFDTTGWLSQQTSAAIPNPQSAGDDHWAAGSVQGYYYMQTERDLGSTYDRWGTVYTGPRIGNPTDGNWYLMSQWGDGFGGLCCIKRSFALESGKKYVFMYDIKSNSGNKTAGTVYVGTSLAAGTGTAAGDIAEDWKTVTTVIDGTDSVNTLWFNAYNLGNGICFDNFQMYELEVPQTVFDVTVTYTANGETVKTETKSYDSALVSGASFDELYYRENGTNVLYYAEAQTVSETKTIEMAALPNWGNYSDGDKIATDEAVYIVVGGNLAPNGNFEYGMNGWYARDNSTPPVSYSITTTDKPTGSERAALSSGAGGASSNNSIKQAWDIEVGETYYYSMWVKATDQWHGLGQSASPTTEGLDLVGNGGFGTGGTWVQQTGVFTATNEYLVFFEGWGSVGLADVEVYKLEEDASQKATTTIKFVDVNGNEIATAATVNGILGSVIDLTDTSIVPEAITYNGNVYSKKSTNATSYTVTGNADTVSITYETDAITDIDVVNVTVIEGNSPILPTTLNATTGTGSSTTVTITSWDTSSLKVGANTVYGTVDGLSIKAEATVTVLDETFNINDITAHAGQSTEAVHYFPVSVSGEVTVEFDAVFHQLVNGTITIGDAESNGGNNPVFGGTGDAISIQTNSGGINIRSWGASGGEGTADRNVTTPVVTGDTYRFLITTNTDNDTWSAVMTDKNGVQTTVADGHGYRKVVDKLDSITALDNNSVADTITVSNIKVYSATASVETYTVNAVAGSTTLETFTGYTGSTDKLGYNSQVVYPNVEIPVFDGYVFKNKTVSGSVVTLNYEAVAEANFFDNVANDTKFVSLNMLGAHDAFTANISTSSAKYDAAGAAQGDSGSKAAPLSSSTAAPMSKAQSQDALTMLNHGVRYFDIRLSRSDKTGTNTLGGTIQHTNGVFYTTHGMLSDEFRPIAYTIAQWAKEHPGEIIVLDFQEMWDNTSSAGSTGDSVAQSWIDLNNLLTEAGIYDYVTINNGTDLSTVTYGSLTENGTKAGIVLFGRAVATNASVGSFILRGTTSAAFDGKMYSNYSFGDASVSSSSLAADYIQAQVDHAYTQTGTVNNMYRVMQAISSTSNLINQAGTDNTYIAGAVKTNPTWLTTLPVVMVNDATVNTSDLLATLKACNVPVDVTMNYSVGGTVTDSGKAKLMVGTLYTGGVVGALYAGTNGEYAVTEAVTGEVPVPYNGSITITVEKLGSVYSTRMENGAHSVYSGNLDDAAVYAGKTNFAAYTWGQDNDRLGVAVLSAEKGKENYALSANVVRSNFNQDYRNVKFYVLPVAEYRALDLSNKDALLAKLTDATLVATINPDNYASGVCTIALDETKIAAAAANGDVVIIGNAQGGLYGIEGSSMAIVTGYTVTVGDSSTVAYGGTYTLPSDAIAYHQVDTTTVYKPATVVTITADTSFTGYYALGADMVDGAQVRIGDGVDENGKVSTGSGLRFITTIDRMDTLASLTTEGVVMEFGVEVTAEDSTAAPVVIKAENWQVKDEVFTSAITNLAEGNYNRKFTATPYVKIGEDVYYGTPVTRSIYQVAAGLLANGYSEGEYGQGKDESDTNYDTMPEVLVNVLNAYVNQTGVRLTLSDNTATGTLTARLEGASGGYTGEAFFTVGETTYSDGKYTVTLTAVGQSKIDVNLFNEYVRINNNNSKVSPVTTITDNGNGTYTLVFDYGNMN